MAVVPVLAVGGLPLVQLALLTLVSFWLVGAVLNWKAQLMMRGFVIGFVGVLVVGLVVIVALRAAANAEQHANPLDRALVTQGRIVYRQYCAMCHGVNLEGQPNWKEELPEGGRPAPPHDVNGHTWHHADALLFAIVKEGEGAVDLPGYIYRMPAFGDTLSDEEIWAVLAYIKSTWPSDIQATQEAISQQAR